MSTDVDLPETPSYDKRLDSTSWHQYICPCCDFTKLVAEIYDYHAKASFPLNSVDGMCDKCSASMDRK